MNDFVVKNVPVICVVVIKKIFDVSRVLGQVVSMLLRGHTIWIKIQLDVVFVNLKLHCFRNFKRYHKQ